MNPDRSPTHAPARRWGILAFLMALCFISHFNRASITSAGDERIMRQFAISPERMGIIYSAFLIVYTLFMIPGGWLIDRRGPRFALACMGLGSALFCAITGGIGFGLLAAGQVWLALLVVRSLMGMLSAPLHPGAARAAGNWFVPGQQSLANGLITGASILAYAVVHPLFGGLIDRFDWPASFLVTGLCTALLATGWYCFASDTPTAPSRLAPPAGILENPAEAASPEGASLAADPSLWLLTISYSAVGYFQYLFFYWLHYYFDTVLQMSKDESRFLAGLPNLAMAACMPVGGWLGGRLRRTRPGRAGTTLLPLLGMTASAAMLLLGLVAHDKFWIVFWFTGSLGALGLCESSFWTTAVQLGGNRGGTAAAIMNTGGNGIGLLAPMVTPWIGSQIGWGWGIGVGAAIGFLGALCWIGVRVPSPDPAAERASAS